MSQTIWDSINPSSTSGTQLATLLNDMKDAVISGFSGSSRPTEIDPGGYWIDTSVTNTYKYKVWTGSNDITVFTLNTSTNTVNFGGSSDSFEIEKISADTVGAILKLFKERVINNGQILVGDTVGEIQFIGGASDNSEPITAAIKVVASDNFTSTDQGADLVIELTSSGDSGKQEIARFKNGFLGLGTTSPSTRLHVLGATGIQSEYADDSSSGAVIATKKRRITGNGNAQSSDVLAKIAFRSNNASGTQIEPATIEITATENHTDSAQGTKIDFKITKTGEASKTTAMTIRADGKVEIPNLVAENSELGTVVETEDAKLILNKGGSEASADAVDAGFEVEMSDATHAAIGFNSTLASKFAVGEVGALKEIVSVDHAQTIKNKTIENYILSQQDIATSATISSLSATKAVVNFTGSTDTNIQGIDASLGNRTILIHNGSTATINLLHEDGAATSTNRLKLPDGSPLTISPDSSIEMFYSATDSRWKLKSGSGSGNGSGGVNYFGTYGNADVNVNGWTVYGTVDSETVGTPNITWTRTTSTPLNGAGSFLLTKDAANRVGQGVSVSTLTIPEKLKYSKQVVKFVYTVASGTYTDDAVQFFIRDVTNNTIIYPTINTIKNVATGFVQEMNLVFDTTDSLTYKVFFKVVGTDTNAYTIKFDDFNWGEPNVISTTNKLIAKATKSANQTISTANYTKVTFDGGSGSKGVTVDTVNSRLTLQRNGLTKVRGSFQLNNTASETFYMAIYKNGSFVSQELEYTNVSATTLEVSYEDPFAVTGDYYELWVDSTADTSYDVNGGTNFQFYLEQEEINSGHFAAFQGRTIAVKAERSNTISVPDNVETKMTFTAATVTQDSVGMYNSSLDRFEIKAPGMYLIVGTIGFSTGTTLRSISPFIKLNGSSNIGGNLYSNGSNGSNGMSPASVEPVYLNVNDYIELYAYQNDASGATACNATTYRIGITYLGNQPSLVGLDNSKAVALYQATSGVAIGTSLAVVPFTTKVEDNYLAYNTTTGVYTVQKSDVYNVSWLVSTSGVTLSTAQRFTTALYINGSRYIYGVRANGNGALQNYASGGSIVGLRLKAGDTIAIYAVSNVATTALTGTDECYLSITT